MPENYVLLERTELNANAASVTFANIPQTGYTDLKIVVSARTDNANNTIYLGTEFNGVTTGYSARDLYGTGSAAASRVPTGTFAPVIPGSTSTANTFSNMEIYIPNYTSSANKSYSADSVTENNGTTAFQAMTALLWSNTAAITSIKLTPELGSLVTGSTFSLYGIAALGTTPAIAPKADGGNIIDFDGTYWIHTFTSSGTFTPQTALTCDYLVIAGGGAGGQSNGGGGGGGAGGYRTTVGTSGGGGSAESALALTANTSYTVTIGAGGAKGTMAGGWGNVGNNSVFSTITSNGGGGGAGDSQIGYDGGSGGGGGGGGGTKAGGAGTANQGRAGGSGVSDDVSYRSFGGGGGASTAGTNGGASNSGATGGNGVASSITGTSVTRAGGGGGGQITGAAGGTGGGGAGGDRSNDGVNGTVNTGSGGGGNGRVSPVNANGSGGAGIVIIRYPIA